MAGKVNVVVETRGTERTWNDSMNCKKCSKQSISDEAYPAINGGFVCFECRVDIVCAQLKLIGGFGLIVWLYCQVV